MMTISTDNGTRKKHSNAAALLEEWSYFINRSSILFLYSVHITYIYILLLLYLLICLDVTTIKALILFII
jgi:hypothetical protein